MRLNEDIIRFAIKHTANFGDTDIFPPLLEYQHLNDAIDAVAPILARQDLGAYQMRGTLTNLVPKGKFSFRTADQLLPEDNIILLSAVLSIADQIESSRAPVDSGISFAYRYIPDSENHSMFLESSRYSDWINFTVKCVEDDKSISSILFTDIADFYPRVNLHRLENSIVSRTGETSIAKYINRHLITARSKYSFGLPVGGNASRLLAELLLIDTDDALRSEGLHYTRYVDDFRFFLKSEDRAQRVLAFLAEHLYASEGLTLSKEKTRVWSRDKFLEVFGTSDEASAEEEAIKHLSERIYADEEPDQSDIEELASYKLVERLESELQRYDPDANKVRGLLFAIRATRNSDVVPLIVKSLPELLPFAKEVVKVLQELAQFGSGVLEDVSNAIKQQLIHDEVVHLVPFTRVWLLEPFADGTLGMGTQEIGSISQNLDLENPLEIRQIHRVYAANEGAGYFRRRKNNFENYSAWTKPTFLYGARCLPRDEYKFWVRSVRSGLDDIGKSFADWCLP